MRIHLVSIEITMILEIIIMLIAQTLFASCLIWLVIREEINHITRVVDECRCETYEKSDSYQILYWCRVVSDYEQTAKEYRRARCIIIISLLVGLFLMIWIMKFTFLDKLVI